MAMRLNTALRTNPLTVRRSALAVRQDLIAGLYIYGGSFGDTAAENNSGADDQVNGSKA